MRWENKAAPSLHHHAVQYETLNTTRVAISWRKTCYLECLDVVVVAFQLHETVTMYQQLSASRAPVSLQLAARVP
jgi:hypothetical protein